MEASHILIFIFTLPTPRSQTDSPNIRFISHLGTFSFCEKQHALRWTQPLTQLSLSPVLICLIWFSVSNLSIGIGEFWHILTRQKSNDIWKLYQNPAFQIHTVRIRDCIFVNLDYVVLFNTEDTGYAGTKKAAVDFHLLAEQLAL